MVAMQKSYQNIQDDHVQTEEFVKCVKKSIQQDSIVKRQRTRNLQMGLRLMIRMKLQ